VHLGVSCEDQSNFNKRVLELLDVRVKAVVKWVSLEPLLGPIDATAVELYAEARTSEFHPVVKLNTLSGHVSGPDEYHDELKLHWVVVGGESGPRARDCHLSWIRSLVKQCDDARCPVFVKQLGAAILAPPGEDLSTGGWGQYLRESEDNIDGYDQLFRLHHMAGEDIDEWALDLRRRHWPTELAT
jgi:protein gp37